jgi:hypothetical protein
MGGVRRNEMRCTTPEIKSNIFVPQLNIVSRSGLDILISAYFSVTFLFVIWFDDH